MIFVTVGTHEQQFDRLIKEIDLLLEKKIITDNVFIQKGYSSYIPKNCDYSDFLNYDEMQKYIDISDTIITHGGPASFVSVLMKKKHVIIVPRMKEYEEHVNNHQVEFCVKLKEKYNLNIVLKISDLSKYLKKSSDLINFDTNNIFFNEKLINLVESWKFDK